MSGSLSAPVNGQVMDFDPYNFRSNADGSHQFGALVQTSRGRDYYRYGRAGAANISMGKLQLAPAPVANHLNLVVPTQANGGSTAIGSNRIQLTLGGTAATNGQYDQGYAQVNAGTGIAQNLGISHNNAQSNTTGALTVDLDDPLYVALSTADSRVSLVANPYNSVVEAASKTRHAAGVPLINLTAAYWGWFKTKGVMGVLIGSAATLGSRLTSDGSTAGAVTDNTDVTAPQTEVEVAHAGIVAGTTGQYNPIILTIG
jgi:hypothetical protein